MALKLHKMGDDRLRRMSVLAYGQPGVGKTSLARSLPVKDWSRFLLVPGDPGYLSISDLPIENIFIPYESGSPSELLQWLRDGAADKFDWIFVDGLDKLSESVLREFKKAEAKKAKPDMRGMWGDFGDAMGPWIEGMRDLAGPSIVFTCHEDEDPEADIRIKPAFAGGRVKQALVGMFDYVFYMKLGRTSGKTDGPMERVFVTQRDATNSRYAAKARMPKGKELDTVVPADLGAIWTRIFGDDASAKATQKAGAKAATKGEA